MGKINIQSIDDLKKFMDENLVNKQQAAEITGQSVTAFEQSVKLKHVKPFYQSQGAGRANMRLYLKSDLEHYRDTKRNINKP